MIRLLSVLLMISALACSSAEKRSAEATAESDEMTGDISLSASTPPDNANVPPAGPQLIKTVDYRFQTDDVTRTAQRIEALLKTFHAYTSATDMRTLSGMLESTMVIRVPSQSFDTLLTAIDREALVVVHRNIRTEDVTKEFVDLESRLQTKRAVQARLQEILRTRAGSIQEVLETERQIGQVQEEIEATISRTNYLKDQVKLSTINLEFFQKTLQTRYITEEDPLSSRIGDAFVSGYTGLLNTIVLLVYVWPLLLAAVAAYIIWKYRKGRRNA